VIRGIGVIISGMTPTGPLLVETVVVGG